MIIVKSQTQIEGIKKACQLTAQVLKLMQDNIDEGITTQELNDIADTFILKNGGIPSFKNYNGYPKSICTSVNEVVVHGIPNNYKLKNGDIVGVDVGVNLNGFHGDAARTFVVGEINKKTERLIRVTKECFYKAIKDLKAGDRVGKISNAIQQHAESYGYGVVKELVGHGVGLKLHEDPSIPNFGSLSSGPVLPSNVTLAIEPMINLGTDKIWLLEDEWTVVTRDNKCSAHYENTILLTNEGVEILTLYEGENDESNIV